MTEEGNDTDWVGPFPDLSNLLLEGEPLQLFGPFAMTCFRQESDGQDHCYSSYSTLEPEERFPCRVSHDDASEEGAKGRSNQSATQEPAQSCTALSRSIHVA